MLFIPATCAGPGKRLEPPRVALADIQVQLVKLFEMSFLVRVRVFNTNDVPLEVRGIECDLALNGRHLATGVSQASAKIPAHGTAVIPVTVFSSVVEMVKNAVGLQGEDRIKYRVTGKLRVKGGFLTPPYFPFKAEGELAPAASGWSNDTGETGTAGQVRRIRRPVRW